MKVAVQLGLMSFALTWIGATPVLAGDVIAKAHIAYLHDLQRTCPKKHLDLLPPSKVLAESEDFMNAMNLSRQRRVQQVIGWDRRGQAPTGCPDSFHEPGCTVARDIYGFYATRQLVSFAQQVCSSFRYCTTASQCYFSDQPPPIPGQ